MSTQSDYANAQRDAQAKAKAAENERIKKKKAEDEKRKIAGLKESKKKIQDRVIAPARATIKSTEAELNQYKNIYSAYYNTHKNDPGFDPVTDQTLIQLQALITPLQKKVDKARIAIINAENDIKKIDKQLADLEKKPSSSTAPTKPVTPPGGSNAPTGKKLAFSKDYEYNAPMIKSAYFGFNSIQAKSLDNNRIDHGNFTDAAQAWKGVQGGRGTIQMDRKFLSTFTTSVDLGAKEKFDLQKYGFRFLYNPTTVQMAWGLMSSMDPFFEASGADKFQVVSTALMSSTVTFDLILNRIEDFNYLDERGLKSSVDTSSIPAGLDPAQRNLLYSRLSAASNPYPETVSIDAQRSIYRKGTMYDIEYLFKTLNGPGGNFTSALNGVTSDRAWMKPTIVELHLGSAMRYRVRISDLSVNHIMFNDRMVPILSTVHLTCSRFNDGPGTIAGNTGAKSGSSSTPSSGASSYAPPSGIGKGY